MTEQSNRVEEVLNQTGLNWTVRQEAITTESGIIVPKQMAVVREDTNTVLAVHGDGYFPYQNHQLIELLEQDFNKKTYDTRRPRYNENRREYSKNDHFANRY